MVLSYMPAICSVAHRLYILRLSSFNFQVNLSEICRQEMILVSATIVLVALCRLFFSITLCVRK